MEIKDVRQLRTLINICTKNNIKLLTIGDLTLEFHHGIEEQTNDNKDTDSPIFDDASWLKNLNKLDEKAEQEATLFWSAK